jgi:hypothetical protein
MVVCLAIVLLAGCGGVPQSDYNALQVDYELLQADYDALSAELAQLQEVYPPRDFTSVEELEAWLAANDVSEEPITDYAGPWYMKALAIQEAALMDGYLIFPDYDYNPDTSRFLVYCVTIIDGDIWYWDPETDTINADYRLGKVR